LSASGALFFYGFYGCSSGGGASDAGSDAASDGPAPQDAATDASADSAPHDAALDATGGDASDGGGVTVDITCTSPAQCDGGAPVCCGTIALNGGTAPACDVSSITTTCTSAAQCTTTLPFSCTGNDTVRFCSQPGDCTESSYDKCCTFKTGTEQTTFCANTTIAGTVDASCM